MKGETGAGANAEARGNGQASGAAYTPPEVRLAAKLIDLVSATAICVWFMMACSPCAACSLVGFTE